ncbi:hypothetical protein JCM5296_004249 [Sporobolomyces johnsonii]
MLHRRGGVAAGDSSRNPSDTTYAATPPSSTYKGPKVAGTYGGFVGVLVGSGIFVLVLVLILIFFRLRQLNRRAAAHAAIRRAAGSTSTSTARSGTRDDGDEWDTMDDAFEMPRSLGAGSYDPANLNESTLTLAAGPPGAPPLPPLYAHDGVSQEAFFDGARGVGTYDPYVTNSPDPERRDPSPAPHEEKAREE